MENKQLLTKEVLKQVNCPKATCKVQRPPVPTYNNCQMCSGRENNVGLWKQLDDENNTAAQKADVQYHHQKYEIST